MNKQRWLVALLALVLAAGGYAVLDRTVLDDDPSEPASVPAPKDPLDGKDEPQRTRLYVDNSGSRVSVAVRTARRPWTKELAVTLNGRRTSLTRDGEAPEGDCAPEVTAVPGSLLTRLTWDRSCVRSSGTVRASVTVDGQEPVTARAKRTERPNVLMIMVDDMRADELQYMTNVQKLIGDQGVTFANGFAPYPLCCPARSSVLNGQYTHNHGVWSHTAPWGFTALRDQDTVPVWLQDAGYRTTYLGKYLNGYGKQPEPGKNSGTSTQYVPPGWDLWRGSIDGGLPASHPDDGGTYRYYDTTLNDNGDGYISLQGQYQTRAYARLTNEMVVDAAERDQPFFSYVSFTAPHHGGPREEDDPKDLKTPARPKELWGSYDDIIPEAPGADWNDPDRSDKPVRTSKKLGRAVLDQARELARQRAESLHVVDQSVKKIIDGLRRTGELDNTLVVFTSDNGYFLGEQGRPEGKILPYDPSLRVPVVMRGPGIPKGEVRNDPFLSIDYAPTFADLGEADARDDVDGQSLLDVARLGDESVEGFSRVVLTETDPSGRVRKQLMQDDPIGAHTDRDLRSRVTGIRTSRYLYTEWLPVPGAGKDQVLVELYDLEKDPEQYDNLAVDDGNEKLLEQFHRLLEKTRTCRAEECRAPLPENLR